MQRQKYKTRKSNVSKEKSVHDIKFTSLFYVCVIYANGHLQTFYEDCTLKIDIHPK